jgi:hypothetical protein
VQTPYKDEDLAALTDKLYVCPQLRLFVFESDPALVLEWVARVARWDFAGVVPVPPPPPLPTVAPTRVPTVRVVPVPPTPCRPPIPPYRPAYRAPLL